MLDRAIAVLWYVGRDAPSYGLTASAVARHLHDAGYPTQNVTRLRAQLEADTRTAKAAGKSFRLRPGARQKLDATLQVITGPQKSRGSDSVVPREVIDRTRRTYLQRVVHQANVAYDQGLFDCCAVMLRRLIETLIIEVFEAASMSDAIKNADGNFQMLDGLISHLTSNNTRFHIGRNSNRGLKELKALGDKAAHNRRFNATRADIDRIAADVRTAAEELTHLAALT